MLILFFKGRFFSGRENHVFLPIITKFCLPIKSHSKNKYTLDIYVFTHTTHIYIFIYAYAEMIVIVTSSGSVSKKITI